MSSQEQPEDQPPADDTTEDEQSTGAEAADTEGAEEREPETAEGTADGSEDDAGDSGDGDSGDDDRPPTEDERLEQITERIDKARTQAEDAGVIEDADDEEYVESGATETEDDQTITPPG